MSRRFDYFPLLNLILRAVENFFIHIGVIQRIIDKIFTMSNVVENNMNILLILWISTKLPLQVNSRFDILVILHSMDKSIHKLNYAQVVNNFVDNYFWLCIVLIHSLRKTWTLHINTNRYSQVKNGCTNPPGYSISLLYI